MRIPRGPNHTIRSMNSWKNEISGVFQALNLLGTQDMGKA